MLIRPDKLNELWLVVFFLHKTHFLSDKFNWVKDVVSLKKKKIQSVWSLFNKEAHLTSSFLPANFSSSDELLLFWIIQAFEFKGNSNICCSCEEYVSARLVFQLTPRGLHGRETPKTIPSNLLWSCKQFGNLTWMQCCASTSAVLCECTSSALCWLAVLCH